LISLNLLTFIVFLVFIPDSWPIGWNMWTEGRHYCTCGPTFEHHFCFLLLRERYLQKWFHRWYQSRL